jgi:hypothetical protein
VWRCATFSERPLSPAFPPPLCGSHSLPRSPALSSPVRACPGRAGGRARRGCGGRARAGPGWC